MNKIYKKAKAKVNLNLEVLEKRADGYHNLKSVFQIISLYDEIFIEKMPDNQFILETNKEELKNKDNIIYKAYEVLKKQNKEITGVKVKLNKNIPMQAGLAGGSTDCATFILAMNQLFNLKMSKQKMERIGKSLGADVVPCFYKGTVLVEGIGDKITTLNTNFKYYLIIIKPQMFCNTKEKYKKLDERDNIVIKDTTLNVIKALETKDIKLLGSSLYNVFEEVIEDTKTIEKIKEDLRQNGASGSLLTGSGSCVYGIFEEKEIAKKAYNNLIKEYETYYVVSTLLKKEEQN